MSDKLDKSKKAPAEDGPEIIEIQPDEPTAAAPDAPETSSAQAKVEPAPGDDVVEEYNVPKVKDLAEARCILEALLFTTVEPLTLKQLSALLPPLDPHTIRKLIVDLQSELDAKRRGLQIMEVGKGFQMASRPEYGKWVLGLLPHRRKSALSTAALETLAIIAYKQPLTRVEVDQIRGVDSSGTVRNLLDLGLIKAAGQKEAVGRPMLYVTTDHFLKVFGLRRLTDMPSLQELRKRYKSEGNEQPANDAEDAAQDDIFSGIAASEAESSEAASEDQVNGEENAAEEAESEITPDDESKP